MNTDELISKAIAARLNAYAPYSGFGVGAALLTKSGKWFLGCNVENAVNGLSICAERVAVSAAVVSGERTFERIVIAAHPLAPPCGSRRQFLIEFGDQLEIISVDPDNLTQKSWCLSELLPEQFKLT